MKVSYTLKKHINGFVIKNNNTKQLFDLNSFEDLMLWIASHLMNLKQQRKKISVIYVVDLTLFLEYKTIFDTLLYDLSFFKYKGKIYNVTISHLAFIGPKIILKDYYNFFTEKNEDCFETQSENISLLAENIFTQFNVDMHDSKILSITSLSSRIFQKISKNKQDLIKNLSQQAYKFIQKGFYGGRAEIYNVFEKNCWYYDVNSLYPFIMKSCKMPLGVPNFINNITQSSLINFFGFVEVIITAPKTSLPVLPLRMEKKQQELGIIYPQGTFKGIYFSEELKYALSQGYIIEKIFGGYSFQDHVIFDTFINTIYALRISEKSNTMKITYKKIMNSLFGKYATNYEKTIGIIGDNPIMKKRYNNIGISGAIAAYARIHMHKYILQNILVDDLIYWDTDGIFVKKPLTVNVGEGLGQFRKISQIDSVVFLAPKFYMYVYNMEYICVLRGVQIVKYSIDRQKLMKYFVKQILSYPFKKNSFSFSINFMLKNYTGNLDTICNVFFLKRQYIILQGKIITRPWLLKKEIKK